MTKKITHRSQLVGGQFYIRAYVNCHGMCRVEVVQIVGKPYRYTGSCEFLRNAFRIKEITESGRREYFTSDLGAENDREELALFPFSNKLVLKLRELKKDKRKFAEFVNGQPFTDEDWDHAQCHWESEAAWLLRP